MFDTFEQILADIADRFTHAASQRKSPMHTPCVVTGDVDARIMVLRAFDRESWALRFHTDARAPKVAAIEADPRIAVLFYDPAAKLQIRVRGVAEVLRDAPLAEDAWSASPNFARRCYLGAGPGAASDSATSGLPPEFEGVEPTDAQLIGARANFAVLRAELHELDWFHLAHTGHIRAQFARDGNGWTGRWVAP